MNLKEWIGRSETVTDIATATPYAALSATLDRAPARPPAGTPLPALWHWLYFLPLHRQSEIGPDGHAKRGGFLPPVPLPRRMWAGSQFEFHRPLRVGDTLTRMSTIDDVTEKSGRTGPLVFVKVRHEIRRQDETRRRADRIPRHRLPRSRQAGRRRAAAQGRARALAWERQVDARRRAAVPLFGADVQRSSHPLRPPLRDRSRRLSGADRPRSADRHAAARPACATNGRRRRSRVTNSARCARCSTSIISSSAASRSPTARPSSCGRRTTKAG